MLVKVKGNDKEITEWAKKYNLSIVKAVLADDDNIMAEAGLFSRGDHEEWREEQQHWMGNYYSVEYGSEAEIEYRKIHRSRLQPS